MKKLVIICAVLLIVVLTLGLAVSCKKSGTTDKTTSATSAISTSTQQTTTAATTGTATGTTTTTTVADPLFISHALQGRPNCLNCHAPNAPAQIVFHSPSVPANHSTYTNDDCMKSGCHYIK